MESEMYEQNLAKAVYEWRRLQDRKEHPIGHFDNGGRFYLDEKYSCCATIRSPSRAFPYSEMLHGRSYTHIAEKYNVNVKDLRKECRACSLAQKQD